MKNYFVLGMQLFTLLKSVYLARPSLILIEMTHFAFQLFAMHKQTLRKFGIVYDRENSASKLESLRKTSPHNPDEVSCILA